MIRKHLERMILPFARFDDSRHGQCRRGHLQVTQGAALQLGHLRIFGGIRDLQEVTPSAASTRKFASRSLDSGCMLLFQPVTALQDIACLDPRRGGRGGVEKSIEIEGIGHCHDACGASWFEQGACLSERSVGGISIAALSVDHFSDVSEIKS